MSRLLKGTLLLALISGLITTTALAWIVYSNGMAEVSFTVERAEAIWEEVEIEVGSVDSGANFTAMGRTTLAIDNAETLYMTFNLFTLTDEELSAIEWAAIMIGEDTGGGGIDVLWGTIEVSKDQGIGGWPAPVPVHKGDHAVVIMVVGTAGYPEVETPIHFVVEGTCEVTPITLP